MGLEPLHIGYVEGFAGKAHRRLVAAGCASLQRDDVTQECWVAWCHASARFDAARGVKFGTYLFGVMANHINRWAKDSLRFAQTFDVELDAELADGLSLHDAIPASAPPADEIVGAVMFRDRLVLRLSPEALATLSLLEDTPPWLMAELEASRAKAEWDRQRGYTSTAYGRVGMPLIFALFRLTARQRKSVRAELTALIDLAG